MAKNKGRAGFLTGLRKPAPVKQKQSSIRFQAELNLAFQHMQAGRVAEAESIYRQIVARHKEHPQANYALAMLMDARGLTGPAIEYLQQVVQSQPDNLDARISLAGHLRKMGQLEKAMSHYEAAVRQNPGISSVYNNMGNICLELLRVEAAERYLLKAIRLQPDSAEAYSNLGRLYIEQGRIDEAKEQFRRAIARKPDYAKAHRNLALAKKHDKFDDEIRAMEQLYLKPGVTDFDKMQLGFGLGKAFEELGEFEKAFGYWMEANRCQRALSPYDIQISIAEMKAMRRIFNSDLLHDAAGARAGQVPIFIVGMPRSGTSLVEQILASHSAVYGAGELEFVGRLARKVAQHSPEELGRLHAAEWRALGAEYLAEIAQISNGEHFVVDKMPENFLFIGMLRMMLADAHFIHCRRDPMDTGLSCFKNHFIGARLDYTCDLKDLGVYYRHYEALMAYWHQLLPGEINQCTYETLVAGPESEIPRLLESCGLPFEDACLSFHETERMVSTASMVQVKEPMHQQSVGKWQLFLNELQPLKDALDTPASI